ncbi:NADH-quinone oxidoreductase chain 5 [Streptomyces sp. MBT84]|uniref:NADH-quinone oxidoreductase subunit C n=1 Tax=Streptomyces sp. MBT84 TaxID=1488414 RepID=UPI001C6E10B3|nr:NADH-quinone oxidoreductase subunit C [Streptomyces sp. MBT84]MBW8701584.1 NADH-quinone oxidoreductase chain 5 [Streptomyces sp. MBT84]
MTGTAWLPLPVEDLFGAEATAEESYEVLTVDVPASGWISALRVARDDLGCTFFDWLSAVDDPGTGMRVLAHVVALTPVRRLLVRTTVPHDAPVLPSAVDVYAGAAWHERETHEMFGVSFEGHPGLDHLLLPEGFEGHPLRKDFVLAARVAKAWPGAKEPGESDHGGPKRRQMLPPGVPDPNEWGPLKGQLPPAPARTARAAGRTVGDRPVRRTRTAAEGSATQAPAASEPTQTSPPPRRARSVSEGSASQREAEAGAGSDGPAAGARRARSASEGSASQRAGASEAPDTGATPEPSTAARSSDAPWHHARPAFDEPSRSTSTPERPAREDSADAANTADSADRADAADTVDLAEAAEGTAVAGTAGGAAPGAEPEADAGPKADGAAEQKAEVEPKADGAAEQKAEAEPKAEGATEPEAGSTPEADDGAEAEAVGGETRRPDDPPAESPSSSPSPSPNSDEPPTPDDPTGGTR